MLTIWKFPLHLTDSQFIDMPRGSELLSAGLDPQGQLCVWAAVDTSAPAASRQFYVFGTGNPVMPAPMEFIGTVPPRAVRVARLRGGSMIPAIPKFLPEPQPAKRPTTREARASKASTRESQIETRLVQRVRELGGECRKVKWIGRNGAPDRIVMLPESITLAAYLGGVGDGAFHPAQTIWVELKAPGRKLAAHQYREHERMRRMGQRVEVVDSYERIEEILK